MWCWLNNFIEEFGKNAKTTTGPFTEDLGNSKSCWRQEIKLCLLASSITEITLKDVN